MEVLPSTPSQKIRLASASLLASLILCLCTFGMVLAQEDTSTAESSPVATETADTRVITDPASAGYRVEGFPGNDAVIGDFVVGPGKVELNMEAGETRIVEVTATNRTGVDRVFRFSTEDTTGSASGDTSIILLGDERGPYTLKDYLGVPEQGIMLKHGQRLRMPVVVTIPPDAEPGGRYGSVLVETVTTPRDEEVQAGAAARSPLVTRLGVLFFVTIGGDVEREGALKEFSTVPDKTYFSHGPINFAITYENTGSVHTNPYGEIEIANFLGEMVGFVELDPWFAMPESLRLREVSWNREFLFGKYTATARINRGYDDIVDEQSITFWVIPWKVTLITFAGLFVVFLLLRFLFKSFEFRRRT